MRHAELMGRVMISPPVTDRIARRAGVPHRTSSPASVGPPRSCRSRSPSPAASSAPARSRGPSARTGSRCRPARRRRSSTSTRRRRRRSRRSGSPTKPPRDCATTCAAVGDDQGVPEADLVALRQLGKARAGIANGGSAVVIGGLTFMVAFVLSGAGLLGLVALRRRFGAPKSDTRPHATSPAIARPARAARKPLARVRRRRLAATTRLLPWMLAGLHRADMAGPVRLDRARTPPSDRPNLDRIVLPVVVVLAARHAAGCRSPRLRLTWIHARSSSSWRRVPQRRPQRPLPQPGPRARPLAEEAAAARLLRRRVRRRGERHPTERGARVPDLHPRPGGDRGAVGIIWEYRIKRTCSGTSRTGCCRASSGVNADGTSRRPHRPADGPRTRRPCRSRPSRCWRLALPIALVGLLQPIAGGRSSSTAWPSACSRRHPRDLPKSAIIAPVAACSRSPTSAGASCSSSRRSG